MQSSRVEAFTDGVLAIVLTIMVLEFRPPEGSSWPDLAGLGTSLLTYLLSFVYVGIYWTNHHHLFQLVDVVSGPVLWANLHLLFWLTLIPFTTAWMDDTGLAQLPVALYGLDLALCAVAWRVLEHALARADPTDRIRRVLGPDRKSWISIALYALGVALSWTAPVASVVAYAAMGAVWLVPDRRFERAAATGGESGAAPG
jgi:uncharacterized membrane protein